MRGFDDKVGAAMAAAERRGREKLRGDLKDVAGALFGPGGFASELRYLFERIDRMRPGERSDRPWRLMGSWRHEPAEFLFEDGEVGPGPERSMPRMGPRETYLQEDITARDVFEGQIAPDKRLKAVAWRSR